jgi:hypothetical protein
LVDEACVVDWVAIHVFAEPDKGIVVINVSNEAVLVAVCELDEICYVARV